MKSLPRILMTSAILFVASLFVFPMWKITLEAPQYPDGLAMYIWIDKITGSTDYTLQNINILNHYVGMKKIEPESIPELQYFPYIIMGIIGLGLIALFANNSKVYLLWVVIVVVLATLGLYDFYLWEYDYGHNLEATAPIKLPGVTYQPPLFGTKWLLNFKATSLPSTGGVLFGISILLGGTAWWIRRKK